MATKGPATVAAWLRQQPPERRRELARVRGVIRKSLPPGYEETLCQGMIAWVVPLRVYPDTYNGHALWYAAIAPTRSGFSLHLMNVYASAELNRRLRDGFRAAGRKLDMGKACIRFRSADDLALDVVGDVVAATPMDRYVAAAKAARRPGAGRRR